MYFRRFVAAGITLLLLALGGGQAAAAVNGDMQFVQGQQTATPVDMPVSLYEFGPQTINLDAFAGGVYSPIIDVRAFNALYLTLDVNTNGGGTLTATDTVELRLDYFADPAGNNTINIDGYEFFKSLGGNPGSGPINFADVIYGPYMSISVRQASGPTANPTASVELHSFGSFRTLGGSVPHLRMPFESTGLLFRYNAGIAGLGNVASAGLLAYGRALVTLRSGAAGGATMSWTYGTTYTDRIVAGAANTTVQKEIVLPKKQLFVTLTNNAAGAQNVEGYITLLQ